MLTITLIEPEIPPNTGNIARLAAATGACLELVGPLGFSIDHKAVRRAGLDYWDQVNLVRVHEVEPFVESWEPERVHLFTTKAQKPYTEARFQLGDRLVFGAETRGLPGWLLDRFAERCVTLPMLNPKVRSLNLSNSVAIGLYEALRQTGQLSES